MLISIIFNEEKTWITPKNINPALDNLNTFAPRSLKVFMFLGIFQPFNSLYARQLAKSLFALQRLGDLYSESAQSVRSNKTFLATWRIHSAREGCSRGSTPNWEWRRSWMPQNLGPNRSSELWRQPLRPTRSFWKVWFWASPRKVTKLANVPRAFFDVYALQTLEWAKTDTYAPICWRPYQMHRCKRFASVHPNASMYRYAARHSIFQR